MEPRSYAAGVLSTLRLSDTVTVTADFHPTATLINVALHKFIVQTEQEINETTKSNKRDWLYTMLSVAVNEYSCRSIITVLAIKHDNVFNENVVTKRN